MRGTTLFRRIVRVICKRGEGMYIARYSALVQLFIFFIGTAIWTISLRQSSATIATNSPRLDYMTLHANGQNTVPSQTPQTSSSSCLLACHFHSYIHYPEAAYLRPQMPMSA